jgi:uncharacterized phage infection (PIP) family protein YhgE
MTIKIPIVSDVTDAIRGVRNLGDEFDKVADSLDDVVDEANDAEKAIKDWGSADSAVRDLKDDVQDAADGAERLEKKFKDAADAVRKVDPKPVKDVDDAFDRASEGADEFKDEASSTAREAAASFDGSADSIAEVFQEVAANAFAGFGPAGAAAGVAVAVGLGVAISKLTEVAEKTNEAKEAGAEWAQSFNSATAEDRITALRDAWGELGGTIVDSKEWYEFGQREAVSALDQIGDAAKDNRGLVVDFVEAFNTTDPEQRLDRLNEVLAGIDRDLDGLGPAWKASLGGNDTEEAYLQRREDLRGLREQAQEQIDVQEQANETERLYAEAMGVTVEQLRDYNGLSDEAKARIDELAEADKGAAIEAETHAEEREELNEQLEDGIDAARDLIKANWDLEDAEKALNEVLEDGAKKGREAEEALFDYSGSIIDAAEAAEDASGKTADYNRIIERNREQFIKAAEDAGYNRREANKLADAYGLIPKNVTTNVGTRGVSQTKRDLDDVANKARNRQMEVNVRANTRSADSDVADFRYRQSSLPVTLQLRAV